MRRLYCAGLLCLSALLLCACGGGARGAADASATDSNALETVANCAWDTNQLDECQWQ